MRDAKLARQIDQAHPEIIWQLRLYGWLYSQIVKQQVARLEVYNGAGEVIAIEPIADDEVEQEFTRYARVIERPTTPMVPQDIVFPLSRDATRNENDCIHDILHRTSFARE